MIFLMKRKILAGLVENNSIFQNILNAEMPQDIKERYAAELKYDFELYQLAGYTIMNSVVYSTGR